MIITRLSGGLGNQMFQYAFGRALSLRKHTSLALDISFFDQPNNKELARKYLLNNFNISGKLATSKDFEIVGIPSPLNQSSWNKFKRRFYRFYESFKPITKRKFIIEQQFTFSPELLDISQDSFCVGIWQSEKYFLDQKEIIRKNFELALPFSKSAELVLAEVASYNSVSLHIRRGDYVLNPQTNKKHGTLSNEYYDNAISYVLSSNPDAKFFVFSDDIEWIKNNLKIDSPKYYVSNNSITDCEELILMSKCKHNIIANSSFSWWGAWLNTNREKVVIAPKKWFNTKNTNTDDLLPDSWIQI